MIHKRLFSENKDQGITRYWHENAETGDVTIETEQDVTAVIEANKAISLQEIQAIIEATKSQAQQTGIKWVDGFNSLIRPLLALQWLILLWPGIVITGFVLTVQHGTPALEALTAFFGQDEKAMAASIASFWLVDRSLRKPR